MIKGFYELIPRMKATFCPWQTNKMIPLIIPWQCIAKKIFNRQRLFCKASIKIGCLTRKLHNPNVNFGSSFNIRGDYCVSGHIKPETFAYMDKGWDSKQLSDDVSC